MCQRSAVGQTLCPKHPICESCHRVVGLMSQKLGKLICPTSGCSWTGEPRDAPPFRAGLGYLEETTPEEAAVIADLVLATQTVVVEKVRRVCNRTLRDSYDQCKERFRLAAAGTEWVVFHGTTRQNSGSIIKNGFDISFAGKAHGSVHGRGIYAGTNAALSSLYSKQDGVGKRCMFVCTALPGDGKFKKAGDILVFPREQQVLPRWVVYYH